MKRYRDLKADRTDVERRTLLDRIQALSFAVDECRLYLDGHPHNRMALAYYGKVKGDLDAATGEYEIKFGPLSGLSVGGDERRGWMWVKTAWPWEINYPEGSDRPKENASLMIRPDETGKEE